jgi:ribosomal protein L7/L12
MKKEISKNDINEMNVIIFNKLKNQLESDLRVTQLNSVARLALAFQKAIASDLIDEKQKEKEQESFKKIMSMLDQIKAFRKNTPGFEFDL